LLESRGKHGSRSKRRRKHWSKHWSLYDLRRGGSWRGRGTRRLAVEGAAARGDFRDRTVEPVGQIRWRLREHWRRRNVSRRRWRISLRRVLRWLCLLRLAMMRRRVSLRAAARQLVEPLAEIVQPRMNRGGVFAGALIIVVVIVLLGVMQDDGIEPIAERHAGAARRFARGVAGLRPDAFDAPLGTEFHARLHPKWSAKKSAAR
jgi:hypothetical protein